MDLVCEDCKSRSRRFLFDWDAVEFINKSGDRTSFEIAHQPSKDLHCARCFGTGIQDKETGIFINETEGEELMRKLLVLSGKVISAEILRKKSNL